MRILLRDLQPNQGYGVRFRLVGQGQQSDWSGITRFTTTTDGVAPANVTGLTVNTIGTAFEVTWNKVTTNTDGTPLSDFKDYQVSITADGVTRVWHVTQERFDFPVEVNTNAFGEPQGAISVSVSARDLTLNVADNPPSVPAQNAVPPTPTGFAGRPIVNGINFTWDKAPIEDLKYYRVYEGTSSGTINNLVYEGPANNFTWSSIDFTTNHFFKLATVDVFNQEALSSSVSGSPLAYDSTDKAPPSNPAWASSWFDSEVDLSNKYNAVANVTLTWTANGETDLGAYIVRYKKTSDSVWSQVRVNGTALTPPATTVKIYGLAADTNYSFELAAVDKTGNTSAFVAAPGNGTTTKDTTVPPATSAPTVAPYLGQLNVVWDGKSATNTTMPADLSVVEIHVSQTNNFTPSISTLVSMMVASGIDGSQKSLISGLSYGVTYYFKLIAVDFAGNKSPASAQGSGMPQRLTSTDVGSNEIITESSNIKNAIIDDAKISSLNAAKIVTGEIAVDQRISAGPLIGTHAEMADDGFRVFREDPVDGISDEVARMGTSSNDYFAIVGQNGELSASIDDTGSVNARTANFHEDIIVEGVPLNERLGELGNGQVGRWSGSVTGLEGANSIRSEYGICQFTFPVVAGRSYLIRFDGPTFYTVSAAPTAEVRLRLRLNLNAPARTIDGLLRTWTTSGWPDDRFVIPNHSVVYDSPYTGILNVGITLELALPPNGSSAVKVAAAETIYMDAYDMGVSRPGTAGQQSSMGGTLFTGSTTAPPSAGVKQNDTGWMAPAGWRTFAGNGSERFDVPGPVQGWDPTGTNGDGAGFWWWTLPSITGTVDRVEVWLESLHWYYNSGGTARLNIVRSGAQYPVNSYKLAADYDVGGFPKPGSKIVDISGWKTNFHNSQGVNRAIGVSVGSIGSTNLAYYGRFNGSSARLRIWYTQ